MNEILATDADRLEWQNSARYHVSRQLLYLRKVQGLRQADVAKAAGMSQPQIARIESGEENITWDSTERLVNAMNGRLIVAIPPADHPFPKIRTNWWQSTSSGWKPILTAVHKDRALAIVFWQKDTTTKLVASGDIS